MINRKIFGSDIRPKVKQKLSLLQELNKSQNFGDAIKNNEDIKDQLNFNFKEGDNVPGNLSSRTPWVRMWTAVDIVKLKEEYRRKEVLTERGVINKMRENLGESSVNSTFAGGASTGFGTLLDDVVNVSKEQGLTAPSVDPLKKTIEEPTGEMISVSVVANGEPKVYIVGNHNMNVLSEKNPNSQIDPQFTGVAPGEFETDKNEFFAPPAGITSVSSTTEGTLGVIKKTTINFTVHNFHDFDKIYQRYFLRPGAQLFLDFGWDSVPKESVYDPLSLVKENNLELKLFGEREFGDSEDGYLTIANGEMETLVGLVTDYEANIQSNGSVECSVTITSKNSALLGNSFKKDTIKNLRCKYKLEYGVFRDAVQAILMKDEENKALWSPNIRVTASELDDYNDKYKEIFDILYSSKDPIPTKEAVEAGVFADTSSGGDIKYFMSWGKFEDFILNEEFGFGDEIKKIKEGLNLETRFNSIDSFTSFNDELFIGQSVHSSYQGFTDNEPTLVYMYPDNWDNSFNYKQKDSLGKKRISTDYPEGTEDARTEHDKKLQRIPLREVFINIKTLQEAFGTVDVEGTNSKNTESLLKILNTILDKINDASNGVMSWKIASDPSNKTITIVDSNLTHVQQKSAEEVDYFSKLFEFNVMSANTLVQDYDVSFKMPDGNIGNMIAIQGLKEGTKVFPVTDIIDDYLALKEIETIGKTPSDDLFIQYVPSIGGGKNHKLGDKEGAELIYSKIYSDSDRLLTNNKDLLITKPTLSKFDKKPFEKLTSELKKLSLDDEETVTVKDPDKFDYDTYFKTELEVLSARGIKVTDSIVEYFSWQARGTFFKNTRATPLPLTLTLRIYGTSLLTPGDVFRVNYLPERYRENVYFQIMKVTQSMGAGGWTTTLETQFRFNPDNGFNKGNFYPEYTEFCIDPKIIYNKAGDMIDKREGKEAGTYWKAVTNSVIANLPYNLGQTLMTADAAAGILGDKYDLEMISTYMYKIKIVSPPKGGWKNLSIVFKFQCNERGDGHEFHYLAIRKLSGQKDARYEDFSWFMGTHSGNTYGPAEFNYDSPARSVKMEKGKDYHLLIHSGKNSLDITGRGVEFWCIVDLNRSDVPPIINDLENGWDKIHTLGITPDIATTIKRVITD